MQQLVNSFFTAISHHSLLAYIIVFGVAFAESFAFVGLVVPGAVFAVSAGFFAARGMLNLAVLMAAGALGAILADLASFYLARFYGEKITRKKFYRKYQPYLDRGTRFFEKHGGKSVFFGRFIGLIRPVIPFLAGLLKMNPVRFWIYAIISGLAWAIAYIGAGYVFGESWKIVEAWTGKLSIFLLLLLACGYLVKKLLKHIGTVLSRLYPAGVLLFEKIAAGLANHPYARRFSSRHPAVVKFFKQRFNKSRASGILLTTGFLVTAAFSYVFIGIIEDIIFHDPLTKLDITFFYMLQNVHTRLADEFFVFITTLGSTVPVIVSFGILLAVLLIYRQGLAALFYGFNFLGGLLFLNALKYLFRRPRPDAIYHFYTAVTPSFPSGHTFVSVTLFGLALYYLIRFVKNKTAVTGAVLGYVLLISLIGFSRLYLGMHWLSDVLGAYFAGFVWLSMVITAYEYVLKKYQAGTAIISGSRLAAAAAIGLMAAGVLGNLAYAGHQTRSVVREVKRIAPPDKQFKGDVPAVIRQQVPLFTQTMLGNPAGPIQALFIGQPQQLAAALQSAGFRRLDEMGLRHIPELIRVMTGPIPFSGLPSLPYYYRSRSQNSSWIKTAGQAAYPRMVVRLWYTHIKINAKSVTVAAIDREKNLYQLFSWLRIPLPVCDLSLPEVRKNFLSDLNNSKLRIKKIHIQKARLGKNILHQPFYWDGDVLLITP